MREEIQLEQGSLEWLQFRRRYRMASETPAIIGVSPYQTPSSVRDAKLGKQQTFVTPAMQKGIDEEPKARAAYMQLYEPMRPAIFVDGEYGCSLDGISIDGDVILEIKTPYKDAQQSDRWLAACKGEVLPHDYAQIQHQLMVTGARLAHFWVWDAENEIGQLCSVLPDIFYWGSICKEWDTFWETLQERTDDDWLSAAHAYREAKKVADSALEQLEAAKERLTDMSVGAFSSGGGVKVQKIIRAGNVNWRKVQADHLIDIDLEPYRSPETSYFKIEVEK